MKQFVIMLGVVILAGVAYVVGTGFTASDLAMQDETAVEVVAVKPDRKAELYGKVVKMEGNLLTIMQVDTSADPTAEMSTEDKRAYMQALSEDERMALKEATQSATLGEVRVLVPVGISMSKKTESGPEAPEVPATLADVAVGAVVSVWVDQSITDRQTAEYVKIAGTN